jgi:hypothetical protein
VGELIFIMVGVELGVEVVVFLVVGFYLKK